MPELICTTVYQFPELSEAAKEKARSWYRELGPHDGWWDAVYEDFERVCEILGIRLKTTPRPPHGRRDAGEALHLVLRLLEPGRWGLLRRLLVPCQGRGRPQSLVHNESLRVWDWYLGWSVWASAPGAELSNCSSVRRVA
jgi:hypothetical protein